MDAGLVGGEWAGLGQRGCYQKDMQGGGWLHMKDPGIIGSWAPRWVTIRPGVLSIHAAGPMSAVLSNVVLLGARVELADFSSLLFGKAHQRGILGKFARGRSACTGVR